MRLKNQSKHSVDLVGLIAPVAALQAVQQFREMKTGECLEMKNCNHETMKMILRFFPKAAYQLLHKERMHRKSSLYQVKIRKTGHI